ncbi:Sodium/calcium exchanger protein-domain-containing protein [Bisporella sp. PMI_857]|nr:Sodium/calcium exchanger protein-domain-containing protein [Bisporella sp. PMI_857]
MRTITPALALRQSKRPVYRSFRAFYITILILSLLALVTLVADQTARYRHGPDYGLAQRRALVQLDPTRLIKRDEECRLVHQAKDKCAFIRANCPDEEAGLFSYLSLYYCNLSNAQPVAFIILALWLALLFTTIGIAASDFFCINLSTIASILGMSESMAGVTFLAFGNGSPDVFSTFAAMSSHSGSLAIGELMGAAGFITAVVAGSMALVREFKVGKKTFVRDVGFFIVAASFSMVFLSDGALHLWECCVMIAFYVFYVIVVVVWHWYLGRRRRQREREAAARGHYLTTSNEELEASEENEDDDEDAPAGERRYRDEEDFEALERGASPAFENRRSEESDEDGDEAIQHAAEMASNMRVTRRQGSRRNTITPIRPSLVGALEFRSVLNSLQKSRGSHSRSIHLRRYSDDPSTNAMQLDGQNESRQSRNFFTDVPDGSDSTDLITPVNDSPKATSTRGRAVSMNDVGDHVVASAAFSVAKVPDIGLVAATPTFPQHLQVPGEPSHDFGSQTDPSTPTVSVTPPPSTGHRTRDPSPAASHERQKHGNTLLTPEHHFPGAKHLRVDFFKQGRQAVDSPVDSPRTVRPKQPTQLHIPHYSSRESSHSRSLSPATEFPRYTDSPLTISNRGSRPPSISLPDPTLTSDSVYTHLSDEQQDKPIKWWPYRFLPSPYTLCSVLFPTLCTWSDKSIWDKFVSIVSAPSIFLLAITLPVVESESRDEPKDEPQLDLEPRRSNAKTRSGASAPLLTPDSPSLEQEPEWQRYRRATLTRDRSPSIKGLNGGHNAAALAISTENIHRHTHHPDPDSLQYKRPLVEQHAKPPAPINPPQDWNRWLVSLQIFTAPLFVIVIIWANTEDGDGRSLLKLVLYSLIASLVVYGILVLTTTPMKPPKFRFLFCFLGFVVAIAWISTIANEVVGVLKAFGVILGISDAILGLTIFAVGNSLGDLVADITVAKLGYPVMALSACFGGPMLNILLGIGISGLYMTVQEANHHHHKHPNKGIKYKPYQIEVSGTLKISGITLLITLIGLMISVPLNKWVMSRKIGWGLITLWSVSTIINLVVEITGVWDDSTS